MSPAQTHSFTTASLLTRLAQGVRSAFRLASGSPRPGRRRGAMPRLGLECLEGRTLPSAATGTEAPHEPKDGPGDVGQTAPEHPGQDAPQRPDKPVCGA